ncbi:cobyrinate a,c-diamide synthase [Pontibacter silvestris]|uniref:Cobyrinate a,c-diamide synthase n=1 Tax=Pontibacter silvestris TaxID=2305183 RepID=A0ABW4WZ89_9BACT|nr:cobyrinate a,c-diamide synthase [Pontibacter silvestris]MCC9138215.1 cobyrinate a,c-diamide synthase [Pontibacter silvestris]
MPHPTAHKSHFLIAAPSSGSGKTTVTLGLLRALASRGLKVQPFKCGPDYLDPMHHKIAARQVSINLDTFMASAAHVKQIYQKYTAGAEVAVTEGVMGLFDGAEKMRGSSAEIATLLGIPIILVINAKAMAYSAAPLIYGFKNFYDGITLKGVIFNNVNSASHYNFLQDACQDAGVEALGYLPHQEEIQIPSRHLGLSTSSSIDFDALCDKIAAAISETVNLDRLLEITNQPLPQLMDAAVSIGSPKTKLKIAVALDEAFSFTYHENLETLRQLGQVIFFSPLQDKVLPECDLLYLAGGYPELFLEQLSQNKSMLHAIRAYCENGGKTYAECGGMMYLSRSIIDTAGQEFKMANFLHLATSMDKPKLHLGYRCVKLDDMEIKGHEFHYSTCLELDKAEILTCQITTAKGMAAPCTIYQKQQTTASYIHLYWGEQKGFIQKLINGAFSKTSEH